MPLNKINQSTGFGLNFQDLFYKRIVSLTPENTLNYFLFKFSSINILWILVQAQANVTYF